MKYHYLFVLLLSITWLVHVDGAKTYTATLAAITSWGANETNSMLSLVRFAAYWLNSQTDIAKDVDIALVTGNCGPGSGNPSKCLILGTNAVQAFESNLTGFVTGAYSNDQRILQFVANAFDLPQIVGIASGNILSNKAEYPTLLRTIVPDETGNMLAIRFMVENGWKKAAVPLDSGDFGSGTREALQLYADRYNVSLEFFNCPLAGSDYTPQAQLIKDAGYRIILVMLQPRETWVWMDAANKTGLVGNEYFSILSVSGILGIAPTGIPNFQATVPPSINLTALRPLFNGTVGFASHGAIGPFYDSLLPLWNSDAMKYQFPTSRTGSTYSWYLFDAVMAYAVAIQQMLDRGIPFQNATKTRLLRELQNISFTGATGQIKFNQNGDRIGLVDMIQSTVGGSVYSRLYDPDTGTYTYLRNITFPGGATPRDMPCTCVHGFCATAGEECTCTDNWTGLLCDKPPNFRAYNNALASGLGALIGICVLIALFAALVLAFRWNSFQGHGPFYCSIIVFGVLLSYVSAFTLLPEPTDQLCMAFPWFLGFAFNLVYGCLFIKTWALYSAFRAAVKCERANLSAYYILKVLAAFLLVEAVLMIVWSAVDPPKAEYVQLLDDSFQLMCNSENNTFWTIFVAYKGAWLIFGTILSFLTRSVAKEYNESKSIAYAIYNDVALLIIAIPLAIVLQDIPSGDVIIEVAVIILAFTFTMIILFFPIWYKIFFMHLDTIAGVSQSISMATTPTTRSSSSRSSKSGGETTPTTSKTVEVFSV